ncbi:16S rRNA (cytidine(1402)-2'-O)-methyltransferase [Synechococcus elongatus]|uniref:16S rRNA (cytidine(1402)-2'-O)-methyltransferase n=1 Tax=Synechococcus elongatus TaxID=32046 RepID=UPI000F7E1A2B|nr:16S rRNA (cytidine(1402)-2'-O)-methyltransferase [Synechococcus elongatus]
MTEPCPSTLYLVGTPLGNLEDISYRAVKILRGVDAIAAEDTRRTGRLLQALGIDRPQVSYHEHNRQQRGPELIARLQAGQSIALVSDAGMPAIADPGQELVQAAIAAGLTVVPIAGPSAVIAALCASGLSSDRFAFEGFLPAKRKARRDVLQSLHQEARTLIFYESPHRLRDTLEDLAAVFGGDRAIVLARELTKLHEEFWRGSVTEAISEFTQREPQGEFTLVVAGAVVQTQALSEDTLRQELATLLAAGVSRSEASRTLAAQTGTPKRRLYQLALEVPLPEDEGAASPEP